MLYCEIEGEIEDLHSLRAASLLHELRRDEGALRLRLHYTVESDVGDGSLHAPSSIPIEQELRLHVGFGNRHFYGKKTCIN